MSAELRQFRHFVAVAEELHFGRAATRLHMSQPPLSQSILNLEAQLGHALFIRTKRSAHLTAAGSALLPEARRLLAHAQSLPQLVAQAANGAVGSLSLAFVSTAGTGLLPNLLVRFRAQYPQVQITLREATSDWQFEQLRLGQIDAGFIIPPLPETVLQELAYLPLMREPLLLALPSALAAQYTERPVSLSRLREQRLIIFPRHLAPALYDNILTCFATAGMTPYIVQEAIQMHTIVNLVAAQMGIALVPESVANLQRLGVEYLPLLDASPVLETGLAWRSEHNSPVLAAFLDLLKPALIQH